MKHLILGCLVGSGLGYVFGNLLQGLPPFWNVLIVGVVVISILIWAFRTLRELKKQQRCIDKVLTQMQLREFRRK